MKSVRKRTPRPVAVVYARVSAKEPDERSLYNQVASARRHAAIYRLQIVGEPFLGIGSASERPVFDKMLAYIKANPQVRYVIVDHVDRLVRSREMAQEIFRLIHEHNVAIRFVAQNYGIPSVSASYDIMRMRSDCGVRLWGRRRESRRR